MNISASRASNTSNPSASFLPKAVSSPLEELWRELRLAAENRLRRGSLSATLIQTIILDSDNLPQSLSRTLSHQQTDALLAPNVLEKRLVGLYERHPDLVLAASLDLGAVVARDPAVADALTPFLYFKGFHALQAHRLAHALWLNGETDDALLIQNRSSLLYGVDIHPAAKIGCGIMLDHATGLVIGETAVIEDHVSILHNVTLGGTGKEQGDRHPKVRTGVMIGAGASKVRQSLCWCSPFNSLIDVVQSMRRVSISCTRDSTREFGQFARFQAVNLAEFFFWPFWSKFWPFFLWEELSQPLTWPQIASVKSSSLEAFSKRL